MRFLSFIPRHITRRGRTFAVYAKRFPVEIGWQATSFRLIYIEINSEICYISCHGKAKDRLPDMVPTGIRPGGTFCDCADFCALPGTGSPRCRFGFSWFSVFKCNHGSTGLSGGG